MERKTKFAVAGLVAGCLALAGAGTAVAVGGSEPGDNPDTPIAGADLDRASAAALAHAGGGRVTDTEVRDEESYYEVEVTLDGGGQVDVQLDEQFVVVGSEGDGFEDKDSDGDD